MQKEKTIERLKEIIGAVKIEKSTVTVKTTEGDRSIGALLVKNLCVHLSIDSEGFTISHARSGYAIATGFRDLRSALHTVILTRYTIDLSKQCDPFDCADIKLIKKIKIAKDCFKFCVASKKIWNNADLESEIGVFYASRAECERLRWKIAPCAKKECLDPHAFDSSMLVDLLLD